MQVLASHFANQWVVDRSHAQAVGQITRLILNPTTLKVAYLEVDTVEQDEAMFVRGDQTAIEGEVLTIASISSFGNKDDFLRDSELLEHPCLLMGYKVIDRSKRRLGRVTDFTVSSTAFRVERLHIGVPWWQRLLLPERIVSAKAIHEILPHKRLVVVSQSQSGVKSRAAEAIPA